MKLINYDAIELRFSELEGINIVEVIYDDVKTYYRISYIAYYEKNSININTNLDLIPGKDSYFDLDNNDILQQQFLGVAKVVFNNFIGAQLFEGKEFDIHLECFNIDEAIKLRNELESYLSMQNQQDLEISDKMIEQYSSLVFIIDSHFLSEEILIELINNNDLAEYLN